MASRESKSTSTGLPSISGVVGGSVVGGLVLVATVTLAPILYQFIALSVGIAAVVVLLAWMAHREGLAIEAHEQLVRQLRVPLSLTVDHELYDRYCDFASGLEELAIQSDPVLLGFAHLKLASLASEVQALARGRVEFSNTETWRTVYQQLLESLEVRAYYSAAWVRTANYWQDPPGKQSMQLNYDLIERGYRIERLVILPDELWPFERHRLSPDIQPWIVEQHQRGVVISLIREHELTDEPDLLADFGIYGNRAVGHQEIDEQARTLRFVLEFDEHARRAAHNRWERLELYGKNYQEILDKTP